MAADPISLTDLLEAVADGEPLARDLPEQHLGVEERRLLGHLRLVAAMAEVHRSVPPEPDFLTESLDDAPPLTRRRWGNLELIEPVGKGAFGQVWRAWDVHLQADVALKLMDERAGNAAVRRRVLDEGRALARLRHPNVVAVYGVEEHQGAIGLRMEFVRGLTLDQCLSAQGAYGAAEAALVGQHLSLALAAVHRAGLVHRDVKAQNVMREEGGRIVLMDLGSGCLQSDLPGATMAGTPLYLSPEVLEGAEASPRSDIYSLGVLLFHLVTNDYPVHARSIQALRAAHRERRMRSLRDARPDLPIGFVRVVERALGPEPESRFASAGELGAALADFTHTARTDVVALPPAPPSRRLLRIGLPAVLAGVLLTVIVGAASRVLSPPPAAMPIQRIAVLPFDTVDPNSPLLPLAHGIAMELTTSLGQIGALKVVPWTFMRRLALPDSLQKVGQQTGADALVEGTLQEAVGQKDVMVLEVRVYHAGNGSLLWAQRFERPAGALLQLQAEVARQIASRFRILLARREQMLLARFADVPSEAVELYLKGRQALESYQDNFDTAIAYFRQAIEIDANFAAAYAGLAECYVLQSGFFGTTMVADAFTRAVQAADQAIALAPSQPEAYATRGYAKALLGWDWSGAEADYQRALELGPQSAEVHTSYSNFLTMVGRHEEAVAQSRIAEERAPLSSVVSRRVGWALFMSRRYDEAIVQLKKVLVTEPGYGPARSLLARAYAMAGRTAEALEYAVPEPGLEGLTAQVYAVAGRREEALELIGRATRVEPGNPYQVAAAYALMGDVANGVAWIARAFEVHDPSLVNIAFDPRLDALRSDPQFTAFVRRMNLNP